MTDEDIIEEGRKLSQSTIKFLCRAIKKRKYETAADRDGIILCALARVVISKIIHRCERETDADMLVKNFAMALIASWSEYNFIEERKLVH